MKYQIGDTVKFEHWEEGYTFEAQGKIVEIAPGFGRDKSLGYNIQIGQFSYCYHVKDDKVIEKI